MSARELPADLLKLPLALGRRGEGPPHGPDWVLAGTWHAAPAALPLRGALPPKQPGMRLPGERTPEEGLNPEAAAGLLMAEGSVFQDPVGCCGDSGCCHERAKHPSCRVDRPSP